MLDRDLDKPICESGSSWKQGRDNMVNCENIVCGRRLGKNEDLLEIIQKEPGEGNRYDFHMKFLSQYILGPS